MREMREVMRLYRESGQPVREIARRIGVARSTARDMIARFERSGLTWPVPPEMNDAVLEARLYGAAGVKPGRRKLPEPVEVGTGDGASGGAKVRGLQEEVDRLARAGGDQLDGRQGGASLAGLGEEHRGPADLARGDLGQREAGLRAGLTDRARPHCEAGKPATLACRGRVGYHTGRHSNTA